MQKQTEAHNDTHNYKLFEIDPAFPEMDSNTLILQMDITDLSDEALYFRAKKFS